MGDDRPAFPSLGILREPVINIVAGLSFVPACMVIIPAALGFDAVRKISAPALQRLGLPT